MKKQPLVIITGPTGVGKTENSIKIAKAFNGEIISADSMQVYKEMDIGTAKIRADEMDGVVHHLIDIISPAEEFNIYKFQKKAKQAISDIASRGKLPIMVGGTGFYIQAVIKDVDFENEAQADNTATKYTDITNTDTKEGSVKLREELNELASLKGSVYLHDMLAEIDPAAAKAIHHNNIKRVVRAIEFYRLTGKRISEHNANESVKESPYDYMYFVINNDRNILYERIEKRIDIMLADGLVDEVRNLLASGITRDMTSMQGIGYKEFIPYFNNEISLDEAVEILKRDTRHFAKRQLTWFKREKDVIWMDYSDYNQDKELMQNAMKKMIGEHYGIKEYVQ